MKSPILMNWQKLEQLTFNDACKALSDIKPKIAQETVLVFCLDCDSESGTIAASINTVEGLSRTVAKYRQQHATYASRPEVELKAGLAENPGDFSHFDFAPDRFQNDGGYSNHIERIDRRKDFAGDDARYAALRAESELFMASIARVIIRLQDEDRLAILNRAADFVSICVDHGESVSQGRTRIERARHS